MLKDIYDGTTMRWLDYQEADPLKVECTSHNDYLQINSADDKAKYHSFNGKQLYLSINLRAIDPNDISNNLLNTVLTLKLKYVLYLGQKKLGGDSTVTGYIRFNKFPNIADTAVYPIRSTVNNDLRGYCRSLSEQTYNSEFAITAAMLRNSYANAPNNTITLSAFANLTGKITNGIYDDNPVLKNDFWTNYGGITNYITQLDVEVDYHGKVDVAIDWVRLETPRAQQWLRGAYDSIINKGVKWATDNATANSTHPKIFRFYGNDELRPTEWQAMKYYNKLVDGMLAIELSPNALVTNGGSTNKYLYNTYSNEMWTGDNIVPKMSTACPYIKKGDYLQQASHFGFLMGYSGSNLTQFKDTLNSEYESILLGIYPNHANDFLRKNSIIPAENEPYALNYPDPNTYFSIGTLFSNEKQMYYAFQKQQDMLYQNKFWWANLWITTEPWVVDLNSFTFKMAPFYDTGRPKTGEEIRLMTNYPLILGAKGLVYWKKSSEGTLDTFGILENNVWKLYSRNKILALIPGGVGSGTLTGDALVMSDAIGGDYINTASDPNNFPAKFFKPTIYNWNQLGIPQNRIYIGLKSTRFEMMKVNKCIAQIDANKINIPSLYQESLMDLRLVAWKGKGFKTWYNQDPATTTTNIMNTYIKKDEIRTAKLWQPNGGTLNNNYRNAEVYAYTNNWESTDSAFYDVTILRPNNFAIGNLDRFYIGVQNRRTDPLVWDITTNPGRVKFYSTAEYYDGCHSSVYNTCLYFNEYYWKKMGCRIIRVPLSNSFACNNNSFAVRIKEILADDWTFNSDNANWRNMNWCHVPNLYVDSAVFSAPVVDLKMQPGEGKIIKIEKVMKAKMALATGACPGTAETPITMNLTMSRNDSLVYDLVFENNTSTKAEQLAIIYEDASGEPLSIMPYEGVEVADYQLDNKIIPNSKAIILHNVEPKSKIKIGQLSCSKKNSSKFLYHLDVVNEKNERCTGKNCALMNNYRKETVENYDTPVSKISIVPNPAKEKAELNFTIAESGNAEIMIVDILGNQMLKIGDYTAFSGLNSLSIDLSNYPVGMYNVLVKTSAGVTSQKFSVMR